MGFVQNPAIRGFRDGYDPHRSVFQPYREAPMRWLFLTSTLIALALCFTRHSGGAMGWWLFVSIVGAFATALAFADSRINASSRGETLSEYDLKQLREGKPPLNDTRH